MLSDGGYGAIMTILATIILKVFKLEESTKKFMKLMVYCGISTMFWACFSEAGSVFRTYRQCGSILQKIRNCCLVSRCSLGPSTYMSVLEFGLQTLSRIKNTLMRFLIRCSGIYCLPDSYCLYFPISQRLTPKV